MTQPDEPPRAEAPAPPDEAGQQQPVAPPAPARRGRLLVIAVAAALAVLLVGAGVTAYVVLRKPDRPTEVVDAYLRAVRDGDLDAAVARWNDLEPARAGGPGLRQRVRTYLEQHRDEYRRALNGREWTSEAYQARLGTGVNVKLGAATATYLVLGTDDEGWEIMLGPEDALGRPSADGNPLLTVG
ncbi:hypothetical protein OHA72_33390 [Dactylosporangium sp. NBC_01737]|uniref:hypothetical protein n=1 Tax=Dactylosporangium sp. NBC_01737 TaxID=2975959 RepID=UPI002E0E3FE0|nr:hypothetical protein OHA72_33390 [Dactylosporangium sp. NBC_01737]